MFRTVKKGLLTFFAAVIVAALCIAATLYLRPENYASAETASPVATEAELLSALSGADAASVQLTENITLSDSLEISAGKEVTLDLNGHTVTLAADKQISVGGTLTVKDSVPGGQITSATGYAAVVNPAQNGKIIDNLCVVDNTFVDHFTGVGQEGVSTDATSAVDCAVKVVTAREIGDDVANAKYIAYYYGNQTYYESQREADHTNQVASLTFGGKTTKHAHMRTAFMVANTFNTSQSEQAKITLLQDHTTEAVAVLTVEKDNYIEFDINGNMLSFSGSNVKSSPFTVKGTLTLSDSNNLTETNSFTCPYDSEVIDVIGGMITGGYTAIESSSGFSDGGGCVFVDGGTFIMNGGTIAGCQSLYNGGGVYVKNGTFIMNENSALVHNQAKGHGGGVYVSGTSTFTLNGGQILKNRAYNDSSTQNGGGVYNSATFIMLDGVIEGNTSKSDGGGVYNRGTFELKGGTITANKSDSANKSGGGVYNSGTLRIEGTPSVTGNLKGDKPSNIHLTSNSVLITGALTNGTDKADVSFTANGAITFTDFETYNPGASTSDFFSSDTNTCLTDHDFSAEIDDVIYIKTAGADCQTKNVYYLACANCGTSAKTIDENKTFEGGYGDHSLSHIAEAPSTCLQKGKAEHDKCSVCNKLFIDNIERTEAQLELPLASHATSVIARVEATCTTDGTLAHDHCSVCKKDFISGAEKTAEQLKIPASHKLTHISEVAATCIKKGTLAHDKCTACNKTFIDGAEKTASELETATVAHTSSQIEKVEATCTTDGTLAHDHCSTCNKDFIDGAEKSASELAIPAGHKWGEWQTTKEATQTEKGEQQRVCQTDPTHIETRDIPVIGASAGGDIGGTDVWLVPTIIMAVAVAGEIIFLICYLVRRNKKAEVTE